MSLKSGLSVDKNILKFLELKKYLVSKVGNNGLNSISIDNNQQMVFVANDNNLVVIQLNSLLCFEWNKSVLNETFDQFQHFTIALNYRTQYISVSGKGFGTKLAVCGTDGQSPFVVFFDLSDVYRNTIQSSHYNRINLVNSNGVVSDIVWHPELSDNQFGCCLTDGSLFIISIGDSNSKTSTILSHIPSANNAMTLCWSPKGKQLVVGHKHGFFSQYKLSAGQQLQEVKRTSLADHLSAHSVLAIKWIVSSLFVIGISKDVSQSEKDSHIVLVSTPSKSLPQFVDFGAVCFDNIESNGLYRINLLQFENIILCSTSMSSEVAVIGCDSDKDVSVLDNWCQWVLEDSSRIDLPMSADGNDTYLRGIAISKGTQNVYKINANETYGGVNTPVLLVYNSSGILVPYLIIDRTGRLQLSAPHNLLKPSVVTTPLAQNKPMTSTPILSSHTGPQTKIIPKGGGMPFGSPLTPVVGMTTTESKFVSKPEPKTMPSMASQQPVVTQPTVPQTLGNELKSSEGTVESPAIRRKTSEETTVSANELYLTAIKEQIIEFNRLMAETKRKYSQMKTKIGEKDERMRLKVDTRLIEEVLKEIKDNFKSCSKDTTTLQSSLIESFSLIEEAKSIMDRNVDPKYRHLLKQRALDPITGRRMQEIHNLNEYIEIQLRELDSKFEQEWQEWLEKRKTMKSQQSNRIQQNTSLELIYKALANNQRVVNVLRLRLDDMEGLSSPMRPKSTNSLFKLKTNEESNQKVIEKLSQNLSKSSIKDISEDMSSDRVFKLKSISNEKKSNLRKFFENRTRVPVRRSADNSSHFVSAIEKLKEKQKTIESNRLIQTKIDSKVVNKSTDERPHTIRSIDNKVSITPTVVNISKPVEKPFVKTPTETAVPTQKLETKLTPLSMLLKDNSNVQSFSDFPKTIVTKPTELFPNLTSKPLSFNLNSVSAAPQKSGPMPALSILTPKPQPTSTPVVTTPISTKPKPDLESTKKSESGAENQFVSKTVSFGNITIINPNETKTDDNFKLDTISELSETNDTIGSTNSPFSSFKGFGGNTSAEGLASKLSFNSNQSNTSFSLNLSVDSNLENEPKTKDPLPKYEDISPPTTPQKSPPKEEPKTVTNTAVVANEADSSQPFSILKATLSAKTVDQKEVNKSLIGERGDSPSLLSTLINAVTTSSTATTVSPTTTAPIPSQTNSSFILQTTAQSTTNTTISDKQSNEANVQQSDQKSDQIVSPFGSSGFGQTPFASNSFSFGNITSGASPPAPVFGQGFSFGGSTGFGQTNTNPTQTTGATNVSTTVSTGSLGFGQQSTALNNMAFCGLGGQPSAENAQKNAFGGTFSNPPLQTSPQFTPTSQTSPFNVKSSSGVGFGGSFTSGGSGVAQTGFGAFQSGAQTQSPQQQQTPAFGGSPLFGGAQQPAFGGSPSFGGSAFGSAPTFGGAPPLGSMTSTSFGTQSTGAFGATTGFANQANSGLSFGALASGAAQPPQQQNTSPFSSGFAFNSNPNTFGSSSDNFSFTQRRK